MPVATELKLRIAPEQLAKLKRHPLLKAHQLTRSTTRRLYNIYFDTPKLELNQSGMVLRLRRSGRQWLQTLKGGGSVLGGLRQCNVWEMPVSDPALDFTLPQEAGWNEVLPKHLHKKLKPVFVTDFSRNSRMLQWQEAQIELRMDQGEVSTENTSAPICELALELVSGEPQQLFGLAMAILDCVPCALESCSKAEQGFRLMNGAAAQPLKAMPVKLDKHGELGLAMQTLICSVLQQVQGNVRGGMTSSDPEFVHQLRVALRRLRVLLRMAESVCADEQLAVFRKNTAALSITLGKIREWDVFIAGTVRPMCASLPHVAGLQALLAACEQQRNACYSALSTDSQARELERLLLRLGMWLLGEYWQQHEWMGVKSRDFAAAYLTELAVQCAQAAEQLPTLDAAKLHALRIQAKKLRYGAEFFAPLYGKHKAEHYLAALSELQDVLGQINDNAVAQRLLDVLATAQSMAGYQDVLVLGRGWLAREVSQQQDVLLGMLGKFKKQERFW